MYLGRSNADFEKSKLFLSHNILVSVGELKFTQSSICCSSKVLFRIIAV
jgi:hypothetical protein